MDFAEFPPVSPPDATVAAAARARQNSLTKPPGSLGRLEDLSVWLAACQGQCPPRQFDRVRVVVFAGDHGVTREAVSAYPSEVTAQMAANIERGGAAINALATVAGAGVRVVDMAIDSDADDFSAYRVRRGSGDITGEDALTAAETVAAVDAGRRIADDEVDAGADLLIPGDMGIGNTTVAATLVAALTGAEPVEAVGHGTGIDDAGWARKTAAVRDALFRSRRVSDPLGLLRCCGGADLAALAGFCAQAAVRRTPVLLDGLASTAAALVAERLAPGARAWWQAGHRSPEPAHALACAALGLEPILDLRMRLGEGTGAAVALPILRAAVSALASMSTFAEAGVSGPSEGIAGAGG
ncbi:nicotinate-nucleotide--dimethylbenzimidazole phosphoribosyltransferase [Mycolicibacter terrae]|uniref:Nicotinate-nucleotide--dimethylbenzimidazole phosphoribosyltransferase n=1 Tax=Mycolicibacter terrae TaxID=1788 RepID=A0AAD1MI86_9MYCO|nr:nicotinate-nucleotide--dimethylbenzimidazole phosphoribosyltransferase [Mycolicibacter terrae]ORW88295.1 nicotinate-nucleotide--dimethylbenzimidazole phosphoribosyltransferase [Mycolicibacter terrae]BBX23020.1 nicotinate-nucleotide--dimethylbenzimidazole phosphoribosyltransferase [Mycolicibacter terrae]SNV68896.1 nicotinate-nucleotide-dimethylbenzimidazol phosphoribosyltransferase CobT [Mycolicibacter terrae]